MAGNSKNGNERTQELQASDFTRTTFNNSPNSQSNDKAQAAVISCDDREEHIFTTDQAKGNSSHQMPIDLHQAQKLAELRRASIKKNDRRILRENRVQIFDEERIKNEMSASGDSRRFIDRQKELIIK